VQPIEGNIWEAGGEPSAITLGLSLATRDLVLVNMHHYAPARSAARSERVRGLQITTRPVPKGDRAQPKVPKPGG
jgi:hypothetical protein